MKSCGNYFCVINIFGYNLQRVDIIHFINNKKGYVAGEDGILLYTSDGGNTWNPIDGFPKSTFRFISPCSNGDLLIGGDYGTLFRMLQF